MGKLANGRGRADGEREMCSMAREQEVIAHKWEGEGSSCTCSGSPTSSCSENLVAFRSSPSM